MSQRIAEEDDWDDENRDDDEPTVDCPYCQKPIPEDTPHCPYCGNYISDEDALRKRNHYGSSWQPSFV